MNTQNDICPNCRSERFGEFCSSCGQQRLHRERLTFLYSIKHMVNSVVDVDGSIYQTTKALFFQPGKLTNEYLSGRSVKHISPFKLYLIVSTIFFLFAWKPTLEIQQLSKQVEAIINSNEVNIPKTQKTPELINDVKERYIEYFGVSRFTNVFLMAAFAAIVFRSSRRVYGEHTVFVLHYVAFDFGFNAIYLLSLFSLRDTFGLVVSPAVLYLPLLITFVYIIISAKKVYGGSLISNFIRCFILFFCDILLTMTTSGLTLTVAYYFSVMRLS